MIRDIRIDVRWKNHPKRAKLELLLGKDATGHVLDLWVSTAQSKPDGLLLGLDDLDICLMAGWRGKPQDFVSALLEVRLLERSAEHGCYVLHDWAEHQPWVIGEPARVAKAKKAAMARHGHTEKGQSKGQIGDARGQGSGAPVARKMPEVGPKSVKTMPGACSEHARSMPGACSEHARGIAPLQCLSSSKDSNPPVPTDVGTSPRGGEPPYSKAFEAWWKEYPVKVKKPRAWRAWRKIKGVSAPELIKAIQAQIQAGHFMVGGENCVPHPSTWLNDGRWTDEIKAKAGSSMDDWAKGGDEA